MASNRDTHRHPRRRPARHFGSARWIDFARGLVPEEDAIAMRHHLAAGCARCRRIAEPLQRVATAAAAELAPPDAAVRSATALFSLLRPRRRSRLSTLSLTLMGPDLALDGVRGGDVAEAVRYESAEYALDLQLTREGAERTVSGQLTRPAGEALAQVPTYLIAGREVAATGLTGELGEFQLEVGALSGAELWLLPGDEEKIAVPLDLTVSGRWPERLGGPADGSG